MAKNPPAMQETWIQPWVGKFPWRRKWQPTPVFLPGEAHGQKSLVGYSSWDRRTELSFLGFPDSSVGKEYACNAGGLTPRSGRSAEEGIGYPLQYSWASLMAQLVMNLTAMWEARVQSLGWEDTLEKGKATHSSILDWRTPWTV